jgi:hypothetical protein
VSVKVEDKLGGFPRLRWTQQPLQNYFPDYYNRIAACVTSDGALLRFVSEATGDANALWFSRVTNPPAGCYSASWQNWTPASFGIGCAANGMRVFLFFGDGDSYQPKVRTSVDGGVTWNTPTYLGGGSGYFGGDMDYYAAAFKDANNALLIAVDADHFEPWRARWNSSTGWEALTVQSSLGIESIDGVAIRWNAVLQRYEVHFTIYDGDSGSKHAIYLYDPSDDSWEADIRTLFDSSTTLAIGASTAANSVVSDPFYAFSRDLPQWGASTVFLARQVHDALGAMNTTIDPMPIISTGTGNYYMFALTGDGETYYFLTPSSLRYAQVPASKDISERVLDIASSLRGKTKVLLNNADNGVAALGLQIGARLHIKWGYNTSAGDEYADADIDYYISNMKPTARKGKRTVLITALPASDLPRRWQATETFQWSAAHLHDIAVAVFARAGLKLIDSGSLSAQLTTYDTNFSINPNEDGAAILKRIERRFPELIRYSTDGKVYICEYTDAPGFEEQYGADYIKIIDDVLLDQHPDINRLQITGAGFKLAEVYDIDIVDAWGSNAYTMEDISLDTTAKLQALGAIILKKQAIHTPQRMITISLNPAHDLYDCIEVEGSYYRIIDVINKYSIDKRTYTSTLLLGAV